MRAPRSVAATIVILCVLTALPASAGQEIPQEIGPQEDAENMAYSLGRIQDQYSNPAFAAYFWTQTLETYSAGASDQLQHPDRPMRQRRAVGTGWQHDGSIPSRLGAARDPGAHRVQEPLRSPDHRQHLGAPFAVPRSGHRQACDGSLSLGGHHDRVDPGIRGDVLVGCAGSRRGRLRRHDVRRPGPGSERDVRSQPRRLAVVQRG